MATTTMQCLPGFVLELCSELQLHVTAFSLPGSPLIHTLSLYKTLIIETNLLPVIFCGYCLAPPAFLLLLLLT